MRLSSIFLTIGWCGLLLALLMLMPAFWGLVAGDFQSAVKFALNAMLVIFVSGALIFSGRGGNNQKVRKSELYLVAPLTYLVLGVFGSFPLIGNLTNLGFAAAFFEVVSGLTTTGASVFANPEYENESVLLWRGLLGWLGGLQILTFSAAIIMPFGIGGVKLKATLIRQSEEESLAQRLRRALKLISTPYLCVTFAGIVLLLLSGMPLFDSLFLVFSTISTTGFVASTSPVTEFASGFSITVLNLLMLFGALAFPLHLLFTRAHFKSFLTEPEVKALAIMLALVASFSFLSLPGYSFLQSVTLAVSMVTTTLLPVSDSATLGVNWLAFFIPIAVGGMVLSTAGGIKLFRVMVLLRHIWQQMKILPYQHAVEHIKYGERHVEKEQVEEIWSFFILCIAAFGFVFVVCSLFFADFELMWLATLGSITNAGGLAVMAGHPDLYQNLSSFGHIFLAMVMIAGRLELFVVLVLLTPAFWRSGN
ncbi:MAG: potassium transporter TrkG [Parvibaculales bacterium]